jgi:spore coat protein CotH
MRNMLAFDLFRRMGHYASQTRVVEVIINNQYQGIYILTEKIKQDKGRVDIAKLTNLDVSGDELTGGYIFKIDYFNQGNGWKSNYTQIGYPDKTVSYVFQDPEVSDLMPQQKEYLKSAVNSFETILYSANFKDPNTGYPAWVDVNSFIDYFIVNELSRTVDGFKKSVYFFKDKDSKGGKINAGPVWDFDWAWKNIWDCPAFQATDGSGWSYKINDCLTYAPYSNGWTVRFLQDENFANALNYRYFEFRKSFLSTQYLNSYIDSVQTLVNEAQARHYNKWRILGISVGAPEVGSQPDSYAGVVFKFKNWIETRLNWLDKNMPGKTIPTSIDNFDITDHYRIFPNPATDWLYIESASSINGIELHNLNGATVYKKSGNAGYSSKIDVSAYPSGVYFLTLTRINRSPVITKVVKQ